MSWNGIDYWLFKEIGKRFPDLQIISTSANENNHHASSTEHKDTSSVTAAMDNLAINA